MIQRVIQSDKQGVIQIMIQLLRESNKDNARVFVQRFIQIMIHRVIRGLIRTMIQAVIQQVIQRVIQVMRERFIQRGLKRVHTCETNHVLFNAQISANVYKILVKPLYCSRPFYGRHQGNLHHGGNTGKID